MASDSGEESRGCEPKGRSWCCSGDRLQLLSSSHDQLSSDVFWRCKSWSERSLERDDGGRGKKKGIGRLKNRKASSSNMSICFSPPPPTSDAGKLPDPPPLLRVCVCVRARLCWLPANIPPKTTASLLSPALAGVEPRRFRLPVPKASSCASEPAPVKSAKVSKVSGRAAFLSEVSRQ